MAQLHCRHLICLCRQGVATRSLMRRPYDSISQRTPSEFQVRRPLSPTSRPTFYPREAAQLTVSPRAHPHVCRSPSTHASHIPHTNSARPDHFRSRARAHACAQRVAPRALTAVAVHAFQGARVTGGSWGSRRWSLALPAHVPGEFVAVPPCSTTLRLSGAGRHHCILTE